MLSRSLLRGIGRGLASPGLLVEKVRPTRRVDASVEQAWREVGKALRGAIAQQGAEIGKETTSKLKTQHDTLAAE